MANNSVKEIEDLVKIVSKLPALGPKSARRIVLKLINNREELIKPLTNTLAQVYKNLRRCKICGDYFSANSNCFCLNKNYEQICVVQQIQDKWTIEESGIYKGHYHILGGTLPALESKKNDGLLITSLIDRIRENKKIKEIIIACGNTIEGQVTSHYIQDSLKNIKVKITKLAQGMSVGTEVEFLDDGTLVAAFKNRGPVTND
jgi:recombination protein RecR